MSSEIQSKLSYTSPDFNYLMEGPGNIALLSSIFVPHEPQSPISSESNRVYTPLREGFIERPPSDECYYSDDEVYFGKEPADYTIAADRTECVFQMNRGKFDIYFDSLPNPRQEQVLKFLRKDGPQSYENNNELIADLESLLFFAVNRDCPSMIRLILTHKRVNIHAKDPDGNTPLHKAVQKQSTDAIKTLLLEGASDRIPNDSGVTPLGYAQLVEFDEYLDIQDEVDQLKASILEDFSLTI